MNSCLVVIQNLTRSGSPQTFLHIIKVLKENGFVVDAFVYAVRNKDADLYFLEQYKKVCRNIFFGKMKLNGLFYKFFPFVKFLNIKKVIKEYQYQLVISNNIYFIADCSAHRKKIKTSKLVFYALGNVNIKSKFAVIRKKEKYVRKFIKYIDAYIALSTVAIPKDNIAPAGKTYMLMDYPDEYYPKLEKRPIINKVVLGQIGYYCSNKNQLFSLNVVKKLAEMGIDVSLMLVGYKSIEEPTYQEMILSYITRNNLTGKVVMLPSDFDKKQLFTSIDILLLPSLHEGLALSLMEAQFSNIKCIASSNVPRDVDFGLCSFLQLEPLEWSKEILKTIGKAPRLPNRIYGKNEFETKFRSILKEIFE